MKLSVGKTTKYDPKIAGVRIKKQKQKKCKQVLQLF